MKRKMRLDVDQLRVDSFVTESGAPGEGTVLGHQSGYTCGTDPTCEERISCGPQNTCNYDSCGAGCTYYCFPGGDSGLNLSCIYTCLNGC